MSTRETGAECPPKLGSKGLRNTYYCDASRARALLVSQLPSSGTLPTLQEVKGISIHLIIALWYMSWRLGRPFGLVVLIGGQRTRSIVGDAKRGELDVGGQCGATTQQGDE